jgi:hypothetical protein
VPTIAGNPFGRLAFLLIGASCRILPLIGPASDIWETP